MVIHRPAFIDKATDTAEVLDGRITALFHFPVAVYWTSISKKVIL